MPKAATRKSPKAKSAAKPKAAPKKRVTKGHKLPEHFPEGTVLRDVSKTEWQLGSSIGTGGFGEIYLAANDTSQAVSKDADNVVKIEPHSNGPLFVELHFYHRVCKQELIQKWQSSHKLKHLGVPRFVASGTHETPKDKYRFLVLERYCTDLQKIFVKYSKKFSVKTAFTLGIQILDILEYLHDHDYVHADIKAANLLTGRTKTKSSHVEQVYLVDFGLAHRYLVDKHTVYKEDPSKAHDGTIEFTSRDAHHGVSPARRGDIEILGYCILQWLCSRLPWEDKLTDPEYVKAQKIKYMSKPSALMEKCFSKGEYPSALLKYFEYTVELDYTERPDYNYLRKLLKSGIKKAGFTDDGKINFKDISSNTNGSMASPRRLAIVNPSSVASPRSAKKKPAAKSNAKRHIEISSSEEENSEDYSPRKKKKVVKSQLGKAVNTSRSKPAKQIIKQTVVVESDEEMEEDELPVVKKTPSRSKPNRVKSKASSSVKSKRKHKLDVSEDSEASPVKRKLKSLKVPVEYEDDDESPEQKVNKKATPKHTTKRSKSKKQAVTIATQTSPGFYKRYR
ncbi:serine/threonine-protein kinase VRK1-like [Saccoglossus kowalevskii]|uniref:non-specific serine/threonine protein kinase n=1 Tax=Saccoglossus kowalevskii TaxID=10224 RepID=A0ABM0GQQ1_SACKO|nr:PREDICTED: serine/threonine-protein kinase VRK1-like [Saccoglossus kowalevskii]